MKFAFQTRLRLCSAVSNSQSATCDDLVFSTFDCASGDCHTRVFTRAGHGFSRTALCRQGSAFSSVWPVSVSHRVGLAEDETGFRHSIGRFVRHRRRNCTGTHAFRTDSLSIRCGRQFDWSQFWGVFFKRFIEIKSASFILGLVWTLQGKLSHIDFTTSGGRR